MRGALLSYWSPDVDAERLDLLSQEVASKSGFLLQLRVGVEGHPGDEIFSVVVCTPEWLRETYVDVVMGTPFIFVLDGNFVRVPDLVRDYVGSCSGDSWAEVMSKVSAIARSEFEEGPPAPRVRGID